jgi:hypothetical protein
VLPEGLGKFKHLAHRAKRNKYDEKPFPANGNYAKPPHNRAY